MRALFVTLLGASLVAGCTRDNQGGQCVPGAQQACACPGGGEGAQICKDDGSGYAACFGCAGDVDLTDDNRDLSAPPGSDLSAPPGSDLSAPPGSDLSAPPGSDLSVPPGSDLSVPLGSDLSVPQDFSTPSPDLLPAGCPKVMIVLDRSGSMDIALPNTTVTRLQASVAAITTAINNYDAHIPIGYTTFNSDGATCADGIDILDEPKLGNATSLNTHVAATVAGGSTNTGDAIAKIAADNNMGAGSYIILITDGEPNCQTNEPTASIIEISRAVGKGIKTYAVGIDPTDPSLVSNLNGFANAGQTPCKSGFCAGQSFYPASSQTALTRAVDLILNDITAKQPGGMCGSFACFPSGAACTGKTCCGSVGCVDLTSSATNCGSCGNTCASNACVNSKCTITDMAPPADMALNSLCQCASSCPGSKICVGTNCCLEDILTMTCNASSTCNPQTYP